MRWKQSFSLPQQVMPVAGTDTAKRKFLDIQLHRVRGITGPEAGREGRGGGGGWNVSTCVQNFKSFF